MRRFELVRDVDVNGVSGTGTVAEGVEFSDGVCVVRWNRGPHCSTVVWESIAAVVAIHGHGGATKVMAECDICRSTGMHPGPYGCVHCQGTGRVEVTA